MKKHIPFALRFVISIILIQTLRFKFAGHEDSIYIFSKVGLEPYGRISIGILELISGILLLVPKTAWLGALSTIVLIGGAIIIHLTILGIEVKEDGGLLFISAVVTFLLALVVFWLYRKDIPFVNKN